MSLLLMFWGSHGKASPQSHPVVHPCEWLSLVFMEQDDDMWEAAKALLLIYLKFDRSVYFLFFSDNYEELCFSEVIVMFPLVVFVGRKIIF